MRKKFTYDYPRPMVTVDIVVFSVAGGNLRVLLIQRGKDPFKGGWAIPGGFVDMEEDLPDAASRELAEETGLKKIGLEFFRTFGKPGRDPRGRVISSVFIGIAHYDRTTLSAGDDAAHALWHPAHNPPPLVFDHGEILRGAMSFLLDRVLSGDAAFRFLPPRFGSEELRGVFEAVLKKRISPALFQGEMKRTGVLKAAPEKAKRLCRKTLGKLERKHALFRF